MMAYDLGNAYFITKNVNKSQTVNASQLEKKKQLRKLKNSFSYLLMRLNLSSYPLK
jgi:hypothetical protein